MLHHHPSPRVHGCHGHREHGGGRGRGHHPHSGRGCHSGGHDHHALVQSSQTNIPRDQIVLAMIPHPGHHHPSPPHALGCQGGGAHHGHRGHHGHHRGGHHGHHGGGHHGHHGGGYHGHHGGHHGQGICHSEGHHGLGGGAHGGAVRGACSHQGHGGHGGGHQHPYGKEHISPSSASPLSPYS